MGKSMAEVKETKTKSQKARELKEKYDTLVAEAKQEQLEAITASIGELKELGFVYTLTEGNAAPAPKPSTTRVPKGQAKPKVAPTSPSSNYEAEKHCATCNIAGHDQRKHRTRKGAFTPQELAELGIQAPA
jgi:hypothetical protein